MMRFVSLLLFTFVSVTVHAGPNTCDLFKYIQNSHLKDKSDFWQEFSHTDSSDPVKLLNLIAKYENRDADAIMASLRGQTTTAAATTATVSTGTTNTAPLRIVLHRNVHKGLRTTTDAAKAKFEKLVEGFETKGVSFMHDMRREAGSWNLERLLPGPNHWVVRLDKGARASFKLEGDEITFLDAGRHLYRHGS